MFDQPPALSHRIRLLFEFEQKTTDLHETVY